MNIALKLLDLMSAQDDVTHLNEMGPECQEETRAAIRKRNSVRDEIVKHVSTMGELSLDSTKGWTEAELDFDKCCTKLARARRGLQRAEQTIRNLTTALPPEDALKAWNESDSLRADLEATE